MSPDGKSSVMAALKMALEDGNYTKDSEPKSCTCIYTSIYVYTDMWFVQWQVIFYINPAEKDVGIYLVTSSMPNEDMVGK